MPKGRGRPFTEEDKRSYYGEGKFIKKPGTTSSELKEYRRRYPEYSNKFRDREDLTDTASPEQKETTTKYDAKALRRGEEVPSSRKHFVKGRKRPVLTTQNVKLKKNKAAEKRKKEKKKGD